MILTLGFIFITIFILLFFAMQINSFNRKEFTFGGQLKNIQKDCLALNQSKDKMLALVDKFKEGILILDKDNVVEYVNLQAEKILHLSAQKIRNKNIAELKKIPYLHEIANLVLQNFSYPLQKEILINENLILEVAICPLVVGKNNLGKSVVFSDITKERKVAKTKTDFVALTAHQLHVPLSTTKLSLGMLLDGTLGDITSEQRDIIEKTYQRNNMLIDLVTDLLDIAKIGEKAYSYHCDLVSVYDLLKQATSSDQLELKQKKINFIFEKPKIKPPKIILDRDKMFIAIKNIFDNAVKYTPNNGKIKMSFKIDEKELLVEISDSGIGVPEREKEKLFTKFFRSSNAIKMEPAGSGLGLYLAKNIIEAHNGRIWFKSTENKGSTFSFTIPVREMVG